MNKIIMIILGFFLIASVTTGVVGLGLWNKEIDLDGGLENQIKESGNVSKIEIIISPMKCDDEICWAFANQKGVINNQRLKTNKRYCSSFSEIEGEEETCLSWSDYTDEELKQEFSNQVNKILTRWGNAEIKRSEKIIEEKTGGGIISTKLKAVVK